MMGVGGGSENLRTLLLSGASGLIGGALSMAAGEFISVYSQKDAEESDIAKERAAQAHVRPRLSASLCTAYGWHTCKGPAMDPSLTA